MLYRIIPTGLLTLFIGAPALAQLAITANDSHWTLENGVQVAVKNPPADSISIIDLGASPPRLVAEVDGIPASVIGPPVCVAIAPDESIALVAASMKLDHLRQPSAPFFHCRCCPSRNSAAFRGGCSMGADPTAVPASRAESQDPSCRSRGEPAGRHR